MCILIVMHHAKDAISQYPCSTPAIRCLFMAFFGSAKDGNEIGVFTGKQPRQVRSKAANGGYTDISLRKQGTKKVQIFTGERKQVKKSKGGPAWMPDKIWKPKAKKVGTEKLDEATSKVVVVKRTRK